MRKIIKWYFASGEHWGDMSSKVLRQNHLYVLAGCSLPSLFSWPSRALMLLQFSLALLHVPSISDFLISLLHLWPYSHSCTQSPLREQHTAWHLTPSFGVYVEFSWPVILAFCLLVELAPCAWCQRLCSMQGLLGHGLWCLQMLG